MARLKTTILLISVGWMCQGQQAEIKWENEKRLSWSDFQGSIDLTSDHAAKTCSGFKYSASTIKGGDKLVIDVEVYSYFLKDLSWSHEEKQSTTLLGHEQGHFDIAELYARLLRKAYAEYPYPEDFDENIFNTLFDTYQHQRDSVQAVYDRDTNHSISKEGQILWENFLTGEIKRFENYASTKVSVVIE
ncbi:MAG: hypothetical protein GY816_23900 [Cytophagales bacterium]|nr:hypothetical protein [Cytophagales bacterium]